MTAKTPKNICPRCGSKLLIEAIGTYGDVYRLKSDGSQAKSRIRRHMYEHSGDFMIYCGECGNTVDPEEYGF